jgi:integrase
MCRVGRSVMWYLTSSRMEAARIHCRRTGPHSLRHSCATRLLQEGASFKEIGDFLGHRSSESAGIYSSEPSGWELARGRRGTMLRDPFERLGGEGLPLNCC